MPIIWPYYNPGEFHVNDVNAMSHLETARQMDEKIRLAQEEQRQKMDDEAIRQAGVMKYQQLVATGVAPEAAARETFSMMAKGAPAGSMPQFMDQMKDKIFAPKSLQFRTSPNGKLTAIDPLTGESRDVTPANWEPKVERKRAPIGLNAKEEERLSELAGKEAGGPSHGFMGLGKVSSVFGSETPALTQTEATELDNLRKIATGYYKYKLSLVGGGQPANEPEPTGMISSGDNTMPDVPFTPPPVVPTTRTVAPEPQRTVNEVIRVVNGRRAIFDASTKQFLRYAE